MTRKQFKTYEFRQVVNSDSKFGSPTQWNMMFSGWRGLFWHRWYGYGMSPWVLSGCQVNYWGCAGIILGDAIKMFLPSSLWLMTFSTYWLCSNAYQSICFSHGLLNSTLNSLSSIDSPENHKRIWSIHFRRESRLPGIYRDLTSFNPSLLRDLSFDRHRPENSIISFRQRSFACHSDLNAHPNRIRVDKLSANFMKFRWKFV